MSQYRRRHAAPTESAHRLDPVRDRQRLLGRLDAQLSAVEDTLSHFLYVGAKDEIPRTYEYANELYSSTEHARQRIRKIIPRGRG